MKIKFTWRQKYLHWILKLHKFLVYHTSLPICEGCWGPCFRHGTRKRQNTAYADEKRNWVNMCNDCARDNDERWQEMWDSLYC